MSTTTFHRTTTADGTTADGELIIRRKHAMCRPTPPYAGPVAFEPTVRAYRCSPGRVALQIRSNGPITESGRGAVRPMYSHIELNKAAAQDLVDYLSSWIAGQ